MKVIVVINEQHTLLPEQEEIINQLDGEKEFLKVPANGWDIEEMYKILHSWKTHKEWIEVIFVSPIPALLLMVTGVINIVYYNENIVYYNESSHISRVSVFHNDHREKVELPDGRIINKVSETGWKLINNSGNVMMKM